MRVRGLVPMSRAIAGSEVAMTVESMFSMNRATATVSGTMRFVTINMTDLPRGGHCAGKVAAYIGEAFDRSIGQ